MADVVDLLHINDITVMRTLDPDDTLPERKGMELLARILIDNELLDETEPCLPIIYEGVGARPVTRWELGSVQVPTDCCLFTLIITTTTRRCEIFFFEIQRGLDGLWDIKTLGSPHAQMIYGGFRAQLFLHHLPSGFHRVYHYLKHGIANQDIPPTGPCDRTIGSLPAEQLLALGGHHYTKFLSRDNRHLKPALAALEQALEDPNIDPGLSQILETTIPFLYCLEQGYRSCLDVALQVLQTFPGLPNAQLDAQVLLHMVVSTVVKHFEWNDYIPLAIKSIMAPLKLLLFFTSPVSCPWMLLESWATLAYNFASDAKEVLPLMDLVVDVRSGFRTLEAFESLAMMRAIVYFRQAVKPGGPSVGTTLRAAEFVMHLLAGQGHSLLLQHTLNFISSSTLWLTSVNGHFHRYARHESMPYKDRLLSFVTWELSNLPSKLSNPEVHQHTLKMVQSSMRGNFTTYEAMIEGLGMSKPTLDDNDKQFIHAIFQGLGNQESGKEIPAEYPKGAAKLVRSLLLDANSGLEVYTSAYEVVATIAHALHLPEAFKLYELFMSSLDSEEQQPITFLAHQNALQHQDTSHLIMRDAISCALETGNHSSALQWSDQGCSQIWNWLFHSRLCIGEGAATDPIIARKLKVHPPWIDSWARPRKGEPEYGFRNDLEFYEAIPCYNRLPGFEHFLLPKTPAEITSLADVLGGPIVYLNPSRYSSHALAVLPGLDDVVHIPLPRLRDIPWLHILSVKFMESPQTFLWDGSLVKELWERLGHTVPKPGQQPTSSVDHQIPGALFLKYLWIIVVKPVLDGLGIQHAQQATADMPRIWWCPSGVLNGLPIHAAGCYTDDGQGPVISDYVVSSYFPSASALAYATRPEDPSQKFSLLTIANPTGAGLPGTEWELEKIKTHTTTQELTRGEATVEAVKKGMENASWAHFACHGVANPDKPWESALVLANHTRLTLREISNMSLPHAEFVYLSACHTAKGVAEAPDESAHLSTGMMACGYRSVIGTLWSIQDEYAPFVADRVYAKMLEGGQPDYKRAACALHDAVQALRKERNAPFASWLPFIHVGV